MSSVKLVPTYNGYIHSTRDALLVIQQVLDRQLDTVMRRPQEGERNSLITSGLVFVFIEQQSGIKRWTDGISWSPSRIQGRFLVYGELDKRSLTDKDKKKKKRKYVFDEDPENLQNNKNLRLNSVINPHNNNILPDSKSSTIPITSNIPANVIPASSAYGGANDYRNSLSNGPLVSACISQDGLVKKTITLTTTTKDLHVDKKQEKQTIHLISYYAKSDIDSGKLRRPSENDLKNVQISPSLWTAVQESSLGGKTPIEDEEYYGPDLNAQPIGTPGNNYANYTKSITRTYNKYQREDENNVANNQEVPFVNPFHQHGGSYNGQSFVPVANAAYASYQPQTTNQQPQQPQQQQQQQQYGQYVPVGSMPPQAAIANGPQQQQQPDLYGNHYGPYAGPPYVQQFYQQYHFNGANANNDQYATPNNNNNVNGSVTSTNGYQSSIPNNNRKFTAPSSTTTTTTNNNNNNNNGTNRTSTGSSTTTSSSSISGPSGGMGNSWFTAPSSIGSAPNTSYIATSSGNNNPSEYDNAHNVPQYTSGNTIHPSQQQIPSLPPPPPHHHHHPHHIYGHGIAGDSNNGNGGAAPTSTTTGATLVAANEEATGASTGGGYYATSN
ncbi:WOR1 White-opaque regulator 1 [Candida maltosa Xu316]|uniref:Uncharacterized protein n=1 Tax=Candida maltosa (strain Xu316) TaxID=1245528 RepID=M3K2Y1_CANMX|nr:hypothetical protein G210_5583 [Candida maltosa Xu316]